MKKPGTLLWTVAAVALAGLAVRLYHLGYYALWLDEIGQVVTARQPVGRLLAVVGTHLSPPLDYLLMKPVLLIGRYDWVARLPACICGAAAVPLVYLWGRRLVSASGALLTATMLALSPMAVAFSQEARMYSLFLLLSIASYLLAEIFVEKPTLKSAAWLGMVNGALLMTHYFGFVVVGAEAALLAVWGWRRTWKKEWLYLAVALVLLAVLFAPWTPILIKQIKNSGGQIGYALPMGKDFLKYILNAFSIYTGSEEGAWYYIFLLLFLSGIVLAIIDKSYKLLVLAMAVPMILAGTYLFSFYKPIVTTRNLLFLLPVYLLVSAYAFHRFGEMLKIPRMAVLSALILLLLPPVYHYHTAGRPDYKPDWKRAAVYLRDNMKVGERVYVPDKYSRGSLAYYLEPESEYVFMGKGWEVSENREDHLIWLAVQTLPDGPRRGWLVVPPDKITDQGKATVGQWAEGKEAAVLFKTQGKGKPLAIYRLDE